MITNWYTAHIEPASLPGRLRAAYALWLWLFVNNGDELPGLEQIRAAEIYHSLAPYLSTVEGPAGAPAGQFAFASVGAKVTELFGQDLSARTVDKVLTETGQVLAEETIAILREERKPVHLSVSGSTVVSQDIEVIQLPLRHPDAAMEMALLAYDF